MANGFLSASWELETSDGPSEDDADFVDARRGFLGTAADRQVRAADGRVVWDLDAYRFLDGSAPETAHPSLWRQGQLCAIDGLFEVVPGILSRIGATTFR